MSIPKFTEQELQFSILLIFLKKSKFGFGKDMKCHFSPIPLSGSASVIGLGKVFYSKALADILDASVELLYLEI